MIDRIIRLLFRSYFKVTVIHDDRLPKAGPYILASNHGGHLDAVLLSVAAKTNLDDFCFLAASDYYFVHSNFLRRVAARFINLIPFDRKGFFRQAMTNNLDACRQCIAQQKKLVIFPKGTRSLNGEMRAFKIGVSIIATELNIPIIPAYIHGSYQLLPKGKIWPKPGKLSVIFGEHILPNSTNKQNKHPTKSEYRAVTQILEKRIHRLKEEVLCKK